MSHANKPLSMKIISDNVWNGKGEQIIASTCVKYLCATDDWGLYRAKTFQTCHKYEYSMLFVLEIYQQLVCCLLVN
jgi:hypothetical protein